MSDDNLDYLEEEVVQEWNKPKHESLSSDQSVVKRVINTAKKYRPDKQTFDFGEKGGKLSYKVKPAFKEIGKAIKNSVKKQEDDSDILGETKISLKYEGKIDDVDFYVTVQGKPYKIGRDGLQADDSFETKFGFTKKF